MVNTAVIKLELGGVDDFDAPRGQRRAVNKAKRVAALLSAARILIEQGSSTDFTMQHLADKAGLSLATCYNLIGTKAAVLYELLDEGLSKLAIQQVTISHADPANRLKSMALIAVRFFASEPNYYRPLMRYLLGVYEPTKRPRFMARASAFWRVAISTSLTDGAPTLKETDLEDLAQTLHLTFTGALDLWVHAELTKKEFEEAMIRQVKFLKIP